MLNKGDGARGRNALTAQNQSDSYGQPSDLTDAGLPSPARALSNLSGGIPGSGISFTTPARAAQVMGYEHERTTHD